VGVAAIDFWDHSLGLLDFVGRASLAVKDVLIGRGHFEKTDFYLLLEQTGGAALPLVAVINFLVGAVLAFLGAVQLQQFDAVIFVANLVGVGTVRETGALMTGIVMAGRTGASFAAVLGTMTVNSEVDALETMNFPPMEFLVAPRVLAMMLMMPLLVLYGDVFGMLGGYVVAVGLLDLTPALYLTQTRESMAMSDVMVGLLKAPAFGAVVALSGTYFGMKTGRTASSVGVATTRAVVSGILLVIVMDAILTVFFYAVKL
ncbi:MAG: ABC transporter permease, partial [Deltaproteobacteria bacterium]